MEDVYYRAGREAVYRADDFIRDLRRREALRPRRPSCGRVLALPSTLGSEHSLVAGMTHISVEHLVLSERFCRLFTQEELAEAQRRLAALPSHVERRCVPAAENYPETLPTRREYFEGAVQQVLVNAYERDSKAREACLKRHWLPLRGVRHSFEERYGEIGSDFIHVHHTKPLATCRREYCIDPERDSGTSSARIVMRCYTRAILQNR